VSKKIANFPERIWDGLTEYRKNLGMDMHSESKDHDQIVAEIRAIEEYILNSNCNSYLGVFDTSSELPASAKEGDFALVYDEMSFFIWDDLNNIWVKINPSNEFMSLKLKIQQEKNSWYYEKTLTNNRVTKIEYWDSSSKLEKYFTVTREITNNRVTSITIVDELNGKQITHNRIFENGRHTKGTFSMG